MKEKVKFVAGCLFVLIAVLFLFPGQVSALDFTIKDVRIEARLLENGDAEVKETFTYSFEDDFNGITRTLIPKEGSKITGLKASEKGKNLRVEKEGDTYYIHRKGSEETVVIDIFYSIENAVQVYEDVGDFYWPFFDKRNESDYENFTVTVYPPAETDDVIAYGTDEAFQTETVQADGSVLFELGEVPAGTNGDIRVAYDSALFPAAEKMTQTMKEEILTAKEELLEEAAEYEETKELLKVAGNMIIPAIFLLAVLLIAFELVNRSRKKKAAMRNLPGRFFVPEEKMSLPATIYFTHSPNLSGDALAAAFLDSVRRGIVKRVGGDRFRLAGPTGHLPKHEQQLLKFLFESAGENGEFSFADLKAYMKNKTNHKTFYEMKLDWQNAVKQEVMARGVYEKKTVIRLIMALTIAFVLLPFLIAFPMYDLAALFIATLALILLLGGMALFYRPRSLLGWTIFYEWTQLKEHLEDLSKNTWKALPEYKQMLVYLYALGTNNDRFVENKDLKDLFEIPASQAKSPGSAFSESTDAAAFYYFGPIAAASFLNAESAAENTLKTSGSSSPGSFGGGGVGGGGGGSGAF